MSIPKEISNDRLKRSFSDDQSSLIVIDKYRLLIR